VIRKFGSMILVSFSSEYVTEKLYFRLNQKTVLVVLGKRNYKYAGAPENSLIFADEFCSARDLAEYLLYLDKNDTAYLQYYEWRRFYKVHKEFIILKHLKI